MVEVILIKVMVEDRVKGRILEVYLDKGEVKVIIGMV